MIKTLRFFVIAVFPFLITGCGDSSGTVATDSEVKAYVEEVGDLSLDPDDPSSQTELTD